MTKFEANEMASLEDKEAHLREIYTSVLRMTRQYPLKPLEYQRIVRTIIMLQEQLTKIEISKHMADRRLARNRAPSAERPCKEQKR